MRVHGKGAGFSGERDFSRDRGDREARIEQFRRECRVGEEVRGKMLGFEAPGLARVLIEGREMLARVGSSPRPGQIMLFLVVSLHPEIVLKELPGKERPQRDMAPLVNELAHRRKTLETLLETSDAASGAAPSESLPADLIQRKALFLSRLEAIPNALTLFKEIKALCDQANAFLVPTGRGRYHYLPWLLDAGNQEARIRHTRPLIGKKKEQPGKSPILWDIRYFFESKEAGRCELHVLYAKPRARYRLLLEHPPAAATLLPLFQGLRLGHVAILQECLGIGPLPASSGPGLLAAAFSRSRQGFTGINLQV